MATTAARTIATRRLQYFGGGVSIRCSAAPPLSGGTGNGGAIARQFSGLTLSCSRSAASTTAPRAAPVTVGLDGPSSSFDPPRRGRCGYPDLFLRSFSTPPKFDGDDDADESSAEGDDPSVLAWPRNLIISRDASSSPFRGLKRISEETEVADEEDEEKGEGEVDDKEAAVAEVEEGDEDEDADADEWDSDDDDEEEELYDLTTRRGPQLAVPLPERLHVPVYPLSAPGPRKPEPSGTIHLDPLIFGLDPIRPDLLHRVVRYQRNKKRGKRYPAKTKTIGEVRGSGRKVRQQKGLGKARAGHSRPAHWRGGAKAHGPKGIMQDYTTKLNKKVRKLGLRHALSQKLKEGNLVVFGDLRAESHKTKHLEANLRKFGIAGKGGSPAFIADDARDEDDGGTDDDGEEETRSVGGVDINFKVASGNIRRIRLVHHLGANVYDILNHEKLVLSLAAVTALEKRLMP